MLATIETFLLGFAAVIDTVLLLVLLERSNRPEVPVWLTWSFVGLWLLHVGDFLHSLLADSLGLTAVRLDVCCMTMMAAGLMLLPAAVLHGGLRVLHTGDRPRPPVDYRYVLVYFPLLLIGPVAAHLFSNPSRDFRVSVHSFTMPFMIWLVVANCGAAFCFHKACQSLHRPQLMPFIRRFSLMLLAMSVMVVAYLFVPTTSPGEPTLRMVIALSPIVPALMFSWYVFRHRLMPIVFERTLVYGGSLIAVVWLHHVTIAPLTAVLEQRSRFDFVVLQIVLFVALIMAWRPLRERVSESLQYLLSSSVTRVRDASRELSVQLSQRSAETPETLTRWLCEALRSSLQVSSVRIIVRVGTDMDVCCPSSVSTEIPVEAELRQLLQARHLITAEQLTVQHEGLRQWMQNAPIGSAFRCSYRDVEGMVLIGVRERSDRLTSEQRNTLGLLFDQFAAVLFNQQREEIRRVAERQAMQKEKLSVLGLLAGSLAHEIRNPLSSMKTIATLLAEDLASRDEHRKDVQMILTEIDRLTATTQRLLESARPADDTRRRSEPDTVIRKLLGILGHLARQYGVEVQTELQASQAIVAATDATLSEIFFNLIKNGIEACQNCSMPRVLITTQVVNGILEVQVVDNGAGISPELQNSLFQPFATGKPQGTGLGLYIVAERIRELRGSISCRTEIGSGTTFELRLPLEAQQIS